MMKHTPGPWTTETIDHPDWADYLAINGPRWGAFARVVVRVDRAPNEEGQANALLIAAAPDLLAALKALTKKAAEWDLQIHMDRGTGPYKENGTELADARAAIAKAEGA